MQTVGVHQCTIQTGRLKGTTYRRYTPAALSHCEYCSTPIVSTTEIEEDRYQRLFGDARINKLLGYDQHLNH